MTRISFTMYDHMTLRLAGYSSFDKILATCLLKCLAACQQSYLANAIMYVLLTLPDLRFDRGHYCLLTVLSKQPAKPNECLHT